MNSSRLRYDVCGAALIAALALGPCVWGLIALAVAVATMPGRRR